MPTIHLVGDSTLDNRIWVPKPEDAVEGKLRALGTHKVVNHAYDGFTTEDVLDGGYVGAVLQRIEGFSTYMSEKGATLGDKAFPLQSLEEKITEKPDDTHYVVLSVGGNDFRERLSNPFALLKEIPKVQERYLEILDKIQAIKGDHIRPILMFQYRTDANNDHYYVYTVMKFIGVLTIATHIAALTALSMPLWLLAGKVSILVAGVCFFGGVIALYFIQKVIPLSMTKDIVMGKKMGMVVFDQLLSVFYQPMLQRAKEKNLPVLDLSNTFNLNKEIYNSGIEPNAKGGELIAEGINHIVKQHDFNGESIRYSKPDGKDAYEGEKNDKPEDWRVAYPEDVT
ncbi:hypothetical protein [Simkania sp.]|uniref:hypothetical protein n=1 Tax=Simkania sp. TaxID=34094 RepID=UPI003B529ABF